MLDSTTLNALFILLSLPLTDAQISRILRTNEGAVREGITALAADGKGVERPETSFASQFACWKANPSCNGYESSVRDVLYTDCIAPIDRRIDVFWPAFVVILGNNTSPTVRLLRWLNQMWAWAPNYVASVHFYPTPGYRAFLWEHSTEHFQTEEEAFRWGLQAMAGAVRRAMSFTIDEETELMVRSVVNRRFREGSAQRRHVELLMSCETVAEVRSRGGFHWRKGSQQPEDCLPQAVLNTCRALQKDPRLQALAQGPNTNGHFELERRKIPFVTREELWEDRQTQRMESPSPESVGVADPSTHLAKRCDELDLSVRSANALQNAGIEFVSQLVEKTEVEMLKLKNFGKKSLKEIRDILTELGLSFKPKS